MVAPAQVVSASLDQTVRVWDISGLRKKTVSPGGDDVLRLPQVPSEDPRWLATSCPTGYQSRRHARISSTVVP